jgi:monofunctional biosynthetic peptidoglycan transglycosylase
MGDGRVGIAHVYTMRRFCIRLFVGTSLGILVLTVVATLSLRWLAPVTSAFMVQRQVTAWWHGHTGSGVQYRWVSWEAISPYAPLAVIAAEDQRFLQHYGFDLTEIENAWQQRHSRGYLRGASTISQQVAKNLFLWPGHSFLRKGIEAYFTVLIETFWPKRRILEVYLNIAEFSPGVFGVEAASQRFFAKLPAQLDAHEAALLAAVLPNPGRYRADRPSSYVLQRRARILRQMELLGGLQHLRDLS